MLWISIHLPLLPLQVRSGSPVEHVPAAIFAAGERPRIVCGNAAAAAAGVRPGDFLGAARALVPELRAWPRDLPAEAAALQALAAWAYQFCDRVYVDAGPEEGIAARAAPAPPRAAILIEASSALQLHRGEAALLHKLRLALEPLGYEARIAVAPTAAAALLLAEARDGLHCRTLPELRALLDELPLRLLRLPPEALAQLRRVGVRRIGECLRLPVDQLTRRFGAETSLYLQRLTGAQPEPREIYAPPAEYRRRFEMDAETLSLEGLLFPLRRMLFELQGALRAGDRAARRLQLVLEHEDAPATPLPLALATPSRDAVHLLGLLRERFERVSVPAPVRALALEVQEFAAPAVSQPDLFDRRAHVQAHWQALVDTLAARLGREQLRQPALAADHRPEHGTRYAPVGAPLGAIAGSADRPLWLLPHPEPLPAMPHLCSPPERIESGWWDGAAVARDYFLAESTAGSRLWVFREDRRWFLHGVWA